MDLDRDFPLGLRPFTRCLSFHAVDLDRMLAQRVETCGRILRNIQARLVQGRLRPLPVTRYSAADIADAFHAMAGAKHTGKLVVDLAGTSVSVHDTAEARFRADASYLVTGGLTGFGLQLARWLASRGAGRLILLGRRGDQTPGAAAAVTSLEALGARVQVERGDVADRDDVQRVLGRVPGDMPLRGVFHAAAVLDDALIKNLDLARYRHTFAPKAAGAWILHQQTESLPLDHFMCFSSMASVLGNQGSANYCAANAFVDALAHHRRRRGLAALTVNWGVIADVGMAADEDFYRQNLERNGLQTIHSSHGLELLGLLMATDRVQTTVCPIDFETWLRFNPAGGHGRLGGLVSATSADHASRSRTADEMALRDTLAALDGDGRVSLARQTIRAVLAAVFRTAVEKIDVTRSLTALGADSLMAIEIKNRLEPLGLAMSVTQLLNRNSVATLANALLDTLGVGAVAAATGGPRDEVIGAAPHGSSWFLQQPRPDARVRLFCFPYAGGGPAVYHHWPAAFPASIDVLAVTLPGRGMRVDEGNLESIAHAADAIVPEILPLLDRPFALFGHCMGAILMYEVAQRLQQQHHKTAAHIFASGCMAPHLYNSPIVHEQDDEAFLDVLRLISFSGTRALIEDPELRTSMFPLLRGDFRSVVQYGDSFEMRAPLDAPITGLAAENDLFAAPKAMEAWSRYTARSYDLARLPGDHYFVESDRDTVIELVCARLAQLEPADPAPAPPELAHVTWLKPESNRLGLAPRRSDGHGKPRPPAVSHGPTHVFCFPPACLRANEFPLPVHTGPELVYTAIEWHGAAGPTLTRTVDEMVDCAHAAVRERPDRRVIFYGHCLGAIVAYELALRLQKEGLRVPDHLLVAGVVGPHLYVAPDAHKLPTDKLIELLSVLKYPFAARLKQDRAFLNDRIAMIRADLEAMAVYQYRETDALGIPITAVAMRHDLWSYPLRTDTWKHHTRARCDVVHWDGDHYVNMRHPDRIHELVCAMAQSAAPPDDQPGRLANIRVLVANANDSALENAQRRTR
jgi:surfactin synthase thioesterase subunit/NAD(P)-dependent dehydrogenase (short-subunit alcohol dehydrogenase family)/acyl carrier protein